MSFPEIADDAFNGLYKGVWLAVSKSATARELAMHTGPVRRMKERFIAGDTLDDSIRTVQRFSALGTSGVLDYVGEDVKTEDEALSARDTYLQILDTINDRKLNARTSMKLTQLGSKMNFGLCDDNTRAIFERAKAYGISPEIDAEEDELAIDTSVVYQGLRDHGLDNATLCLQAARIKSLDEARALREKGANIRLVKGAYRERKNVAYQKKREVDDNFIAVADVLIDGVRANGSRLIIGSHDDRMIDHVRGKIDSDYVNGNNIEFDMLLGVRNDRLRQLASEGYMTGVYIPYGKAWFPYFCRRLGERPANLGFVLRNLRAA